MKTKTIVTVLALTVAQGASALSVNANLNTNANIPTASPSEASLQVGANTRVGSSASNTVSVDAGMNANASTNTNNGSEVSATSGTDVMTTQSSENTVHSVDTSDDSKVTVKYMRPAKLFGFIPVNVTERATIKVESDGTRTAEVSKSWWSFLASTEAKTDAFLAALKARLQASAMVNANTKLSEEDKTRMVSEINAAADATYR